MQKFVSTRFKCPVYVVNTNGIGETCTPLQLSIQSDWMCHCHKALFHFQLKTLKLNLLTTAAVSDCKVCILVIPVRPFLFQHSAVFAIQQIPAHLDADRNAPHCFKLNINFRQYNEVNPKKNGICISDLSKWLFCRFTSIKSTHIESILFNYTTENWTKKRP